MKYFALILMSLVASSNVFATYHPRGDVDRDGVPNYRDADNKHRPYGDKDQDGIPNKRDRHNNNRDYGDKDHDGIANIRDDRDNRLDPPKNR